jgi:universal stress protein family protein
VLRHADVQEPVIRAYRVREEAATKARMRRQIARLGLDRTPMTLATAHGHPAHSTLRHAQELDADLIVAGKQGRSRVGGFLLGSVSSGLVSESVCDVIVVPQRFDPAVPRSASDRKMLHVSTLQPDSASVARGAEADFRTAARLPHDGERLPSRRTA